MHKLRKFMVDELRIKQALGTSDKELEDVVIRTLKAMTRAYQTATDALNVATGHPDEVGKGPQLKKDEGFTVVDERTKGTEK